MFLSSYILVELSLFLFTALYSVILFCVFLWIPFVYFYYEEKDDDDTSKCTVSIIVGGLNDYFLLFQKMT